MHHGSTSTIVAKMFSMLPRIFSISIWLNKLATHTRSY